MKTRLAFAVCSMLVGLALTSSATAAPVSLSFGGTVGFADPSASSFASLGSAFTVTLTYDDATAPFFTSPTSAGYAAISALQFTVGTYSGSASGGNIFVTDDVSDSLEFMTTTATGLTGPPIGSNTLDQLVIFLLDSTGTALTSTLLPDSPPSLADFQLASLSIQGGFVPDLGGRPLLFGGSVTSIASATVPEPGSIMLLGSGFAVLAGTLWRRYRRK